jgi:hypothetical protein
VINDVQLSLLEDN